MKEKLNLFWNFLYVYIYIFIGEEINIYKKVLKVKKKKNKYKGNYFGYCLLLLF